MAQKKRSAALARLVDSIEVTNADGTKLMVPVDAQANAILNKIMASQMRALIQKSMEKFANIDHMTPKELKELTEAARNVAEFSGEVYKAGEEISEPGEKKVDPIVQDAIDFSAIKSQSKDDKQPPPEEQKEQPEQTESKDEQTDKA